MYGISVARPDMGNILAVQPHVPLVEGLAPVNKIILAYCKSPSKPPDSVKEPTHKKTAVT